MRRAALASLAATAAVLTGCGGAGHAPATASAASTSRATLESTNWATAPYPFDCDRVGYLVLRTRYADLNGDGVPDAVVLVRCNAGAGNPPVALYAFDGASSPSRPRVMATLVSVNTDRIASDVTVTGTTITLDAYGYSSDSVPRCCPDQKFRLTWRWHGSSYTSDSRLLSPPSA